jgi:hypothetical protein
LKAWQPILTPKTVLPLFFIVGVIFAPIGGLLLYASAQVGTLYGMRQGDRLTLQPGPGDLHRLHKLQLHRAPSPRRLRPHSRQPPQINPLEQSLSDVQIQGGPSGDVGLGT